MATSRIDSGYLCRTFKFTHGNMNNRWHIANGIAEKQPRPKYAVPKTAAVLARSHLLVVDLGDLMRFRLGLGSGSGSNFHHCIWLD